MTRIYFGLETYENVLKYENALAYYESFNNRHRLKIHIGP